MCSSIPAERTELYGNESTDLFTFRLIFMHISSVTCCFFTTLHVAVTLEFPSRDPSICLVCSKHETRGFENKRPKVLVFNHMLRLKTIRCICTNVRMWDHFILKLSGRSDGKSPSSTSQTLFYGSKRHSTPPSSVVLLQYRATQKALSLSSNKTVGLQLVGVCVVFVDLCKVNRCKLDVSDADTEKTKQLRSIKKAPTLQIRPTQL